MNKEQENNKDLTFHGTREYGDSTITPKAKLDVTSNKESMRESIKVEIVNSKIKFSSGHQSFTLEYTSDEKEDTEWMAKTLRDFFENNVALALKEQIEEIEVLTKIIDKYEKLVTLQEKDIKMSDGLLKEALDSYKELLKNIKQD
jgi:hypothetical protein